MNATGVNAGGPAQRYREILDQQTEMICRYSPDDLVLTYANLSYAARHGHDSRSIVGHCLLEFFPDDQHEWVRWHVDRFGGHLPLTRHTNQVRQADGTLAWIAWTDTAIFDNAGRVVEIQAVGRDVTASRALAEAVRRSEERFRHAFDDAPIGMAVLDEQMTLVRANRALCSFLGVADPAVVEGRRIADLVDPADAATVAALDLDDPRRTDRFRGEVRFVDAAGSRRWGELSISLMAGEQENRWERLVQVVDLVDRKKAEERLAHDALHDPLTGLPNRAMLLDRLQHALQLRRRGGGDVAVLFGDLDEFKLVNDTMGHECGDMLLRVVARRLAEAHRDADTLARFGGDEFVVLAEGLSGPADAEELARRLISALSDPVDVGGIPVTVGLSVGIAVSDDAATASRLIREADAAMYVAKEQGVPRIAFYDAATTSRAADRLSLHTELQRAVATDELGVVFQPIVDHVGRAVAIEALLRWDRGPAGVWLPGRFLDVAEETGLIVPIGQRVLELACAQAVTFSRTSGRDIEAWVNVCGRELAQAGFVDTVRAALIASGLAPQQLCLELTEWAVLSGVDTVGAAVAELKSMGVRLALDDFGTGYSALDLLRRFPLDTLKIDRNFVVGAADPSTKDRALVTAIADLANALGLTVVGEGVETAEQERMLRDLGVPLLQGYWFARPDRAVAMGTWFGVEPGPLPPPAASMSAGR